MPRCYDSDGTSLEPGQVAAPGQGPAGNLSHPHPHPGVTPRVPAPCDWAQIGQGSAERDKAGEGRLGPAPRGLRWGSRAQLPSCSDSTRSGSGVGAPAWLLLTLTARPCRPQGRSHGPAHRPHLPSRQPAPAKGPSSCGLLWRGPCEPRAGPRAVAVPREGPRGSCGGADTGREAQGWDQSQRPWGPQEELAWGLTGGSPPQAAWPHPGLATM